MQCVSVIRCLLRWEVGGWGGTIHTRWMHTYCNMLFLTASTLRSVCTSLPLTLICRFQSSKFSCPPSSRKVDRHVERMKWLVKESALAFRRRCCMMSTWSIAQIPQLLQFFQWARTQKKHVSKCFCAFKRGECVLSNYTNIIVSWVRTHLRYRNFKKQ